MQGEIMFPFYTI